MLPSLQVGPPLVSYDNYATDRSGGAVQKHLRITPANLKLTLEFSDFGIGDVGINDVEEISEFFTIPNKADLRNHVSIGTLTWFSDGKLERFLQAVGI